MQISIPLAESDIDEADNSRQVKSTRHGGASAFNTPEYFIRLDLMNELHLSRLTNNSAYIEG